MIKRNVCLLVNPLAGNGSSLKKLEKIEKALNALSISYRTIITRSVLHAQETAITAAHRGEYVAVLGGDGSMSVIAEALKNTNGVLVPLPAGRGNDFVRSLNYPKDPVQACNIFINGKETLIDMGLANGRSFLTICSLGLESMAMKIVQSAKIIKGRFLYTYAGFRTLPSWKPADFKITIDGTAREHTGYTVAIANTPSYGGGMRLAPHASLKDGLLDIVTIGKVSKCRFFFNFPSVFRGTHANKQGVNTTRGSLIHVDADSKYVVYADGERVSPPPVLIQCVPNALRILLP